MQPIKRHSLLLLLVFSTFFFACKKDMNNVSGPASETPDLVEKINSSVSGFVTDENNAPVSGALAKMGELTVTTDQYGFFEIKNTPVVKIAASVSITKPGYFKGVKTFIATSGKAAFFRVQLIPKITAGTISGTSGGNVTLSSGLIIALPANAVVNATTHLSYNGTVNVAAYWINPTANNLAAIMPGDLRGVDEAGSLRKLSSYGMAAVELTGASGELLQVATGKAATLTMPLPASLSATAPASIPLWYFDENSGLWKQEGSAVKTGNTYVGEVKHFSYWNCDVPAGYVQFNCTIVDANGNPIPFAVVKVSLQSDPSNDGWGFTDSTGYTGGAVPDNAQLTLEVFSNYGCNTPVYTQNFTTTNIDISLGTITVNVAGLTATVSGTATNCSSSPVSSGYIIMLADNNVYSRYALNSNGTYNFTTLLCTAPLNVSFIAEDLSNLKQSDPLTYVLNAGANNIPNLQACALSAAEFFSYTINGTLYSFSNASDTLLHSNYGGNSMAHVGAFNTTNHYTYISFDNTGVALNSVQGITTFYSTDTPDSAHVTTTVPLTITEYGAVGQFISGNFSGVFTGNPPGNALYNINGAFRVRRTF